MIRTNLDPNEPQWAKKHKPHSWRVIDSRADFLGVPENMVCCICLRLIQMQIFKGSSVCSEDCRKDRDNDHEPFKAVNLRVHEGEDI